VNGVCLNSFTNTLAGGGTGTTTFYSGGVVFSDGTKLTQSAAAANFFWDETNKRLGIGTSTPLAKIQVAADNSGGLAPQLILSGSTNANAGLVEQYITGTGVGAISALSDITSLTETTLGLNPLGGKVVVGGGVSAVPGSALSVYSGVSIGSTYATFAAPASGLLVQSTTGIATSSPFARLSIHANNGSLVTNLFAIGSSTATATTTLFLIRNTGAITSNATATSTFAADLSTTGLSVTGNITTGSLTTAALSNTGNEQITGGLGVGVSNTTAGTIQTSGSIIAGCSVYRPRF
jgi:hypothetical protein